MSWELPIFLSNGILAIRDSDLVSVADLTLITAFTLWSVILLLPLKGIERREVITGLTYVLFMLGSGIMLILALPHSFGARDHLSRSLLLILFITLISGLRWLLYYLRSKNLIMKGGR